VTSTDELGVLTVSFNTMSAQLLEAQQKTEESRRATETTRAYLESILGNLSAGVLAFDDAYRPAHRQRERGGDPAAAAR
jgi:nitrogen fixation/metabolism regulation signal transduction histidine kinase